MWVLCQLRCMHTMPPERHVSNVHAEQTPCVGCVEVAAPRTHPRGALLQGVHLASQHQLSMLLLLGSACLLYQYCPKTCGSTCAVLQVDRTPQLCVSARVWHCRVHHFIRPAVLHGHMAAAWL
jgi:hypothetical protein